MRHRLVTPGCERFVPFAESCITKLKNLNLPYADQSFEVEGCSIKVRIEPGHEYIRIDGGGVAYMESGQLEWSFPGELNSERYDPASWRFLDIPTTDKYLGLVSTSGKMVGEQKKGQLLSNGMDSQAVGYPVKPSLTAAQTSELREAFGNQTVLAKLTQGVFPPSLFSGKMRLFMQAKYGAAAKLDYYPIQIDGEGASISLFYVDRKGNRLQFGLWAHASPGIYTAPEGRGYWLINFRAGGLGEFVATAYPLLLASESAGLRNRLKDPDISELERTQCEAYILAGADIDLSAGQVIGTVTGAEGFALSYGWKFSRSGSKASVVLVQAFDNGSDNDRYWKSRTVHCTIGSSVDSSGATSFTFGSGITQHGNWNWDTYAEFNIFNPEDERATGPLYCISRENPATMRAPFDFSNVSIYGYYVGEVWTPVKISRTIPTGPWPKMRNKITGTFATTTLADLSTLGGADQYLSTIANLPFAYEQHDITESRSMELTVGERVFNGSAEFGAHSWRTRTMSSGATISVGFPRIFTDGGYPGSDPPGSDYTGNPTGGTHFAVTGTTTLKQKIYNGWIHNLWALVIPGTECESVIVASVLDESFTVGTTTTVGTGVVTFFGSTEDNVLGDGTGMAYSFSPWCGSRYVGGGSGIPDDHVTTTGTEPGPPWSYHVHNFSFAVPGTEGTPSGSYYTLFNVDSGNPYYNGIMYSINSYGGRYAMSEYQNSPISVNYQHRFVGWA